MEKPDYPLRILLACLCLGLVTCSPTNGRKPWREELTVIVTPDERNVDKDFELQLAALFARQLQVPLHVLPLPLDEIPAALIGNRAHIAAAGLRSSESGSLRFSPSYQTVSEQAICKVPPRRLSGLVGKSIVVVAGSAQEAALREAQQKLPQLRWEARRQATVSSLLAEVSAGKLECTIANEEQLALEHNYYPDLAGAFDVAAPSKLAWGLAQDSDEDLLAQIKEFFAQIKHDGTLRRLLDRNYGHNERLEPVDSVTFVTKARTELPRLRPLFEEAARITGIEWELLAAAGYHESHWNPLATSFTNVRGLMMLTEDTADRMGVTDRLDPRQSIMAGARYLQLLMEQLPLRIPDEERPWLALAAYNQGLGHLEDARVLTARAGLNADSWADVKKIMPLLAQPEFYEQTKHGYARGGEAVVLVETVHLYYDLLKHMDAHDIPLLPETPFRLRLPRITLFKAPG